MKTLLASLLALLAILPARAQQSKPEAPAGTRIGTATRLVVKFQDLEGQVITALQKKDQAALDRLLAPEFQVWTPEPPGEPVSRAVWLQKMATASAPQSFSLRQMAVRDLGEHAIANFVLIEGLGGGQSAHFVVDVWARSGSAWTLTDRYVSQVSASEYRAKRKPTGKE